MTLVLWMAQGGRLKELTLTLNESLLQKKKSSKETDQKVHKNERLNKMPPRIQIRRELPAAEAMGLQRPSTLVQDGHQCTKQVQNDPTLSLIIRVVRYVKPIIVPGLAWTSSGVVRLSENPANQVNAR